MKKDALHPAQARILRELLFHPEARYSDMNRTGLGSDHFNFHVKQLLEAGLIEKTPGKAYALTTPGKEFANRLDTDEVVIERQPKIAVLIIPVRERNGAKEYLVQRRLKQPYFGYHGFMTGKIRWGSTVEETAARELLEETGLTAGEFRIRGIKHKMDYDAEGKLLEDKIFFIIMARGCSDTLTPQFEGGENRWCSTEEIATLSPVFDGVQESIDIAEDAAFSFVEKKYTVSGY